jgi:hypothetical protein
MVRQKIGQDFRKYRGSKIELENNVFYFLQKMVL